MEADSVPSSISSSSVSPSTSSTSINDHDGSSSSVTSASSGNGFYSLFPPPDAHSSTLMSDHASSSSSTSSSASLSSSSPSFSSFPLTSFSTGNSSLLFDSSSSLCPSSPNEDSLAAAFSSSSPLGFSYASLTSAPSPTSSSQGVNSSSCSLFSSSAFSSSFSSPLDGENSSSTPLSTISCGIPALPPPRIQLPSSSSTSASSCSTSESSSDNMDVESSSQPSLSLFPESSSSSSSSLFSSSPFSSSQKAKKKKSSLGLRRGSAPSGIAIGEGEHRTVSLEMPPAPSLVAKRPHTLPKAKKPKIYSIRDYALVETLQEMHSSKLFAQSHAVSIARTAIHVPARLAESYQLAKCQALHCRSPSPPPHGESAPVHPMMPHFTPQYGRHRRPSDLSATQSSPLLRKKRASWPNTRSNDEKLKPTLLHRRSTFPQMKFSAAPELHVHRRCSLSTPLAPSTTHHHVYHHLCPPPPAPFTTVGTRVHVVNLRQQLLQSHVAKKIQRGYAFHDPESELFGEPCPDDGDDGYGADPFASDCPFDTSEERHEDVRTHNSPLPSSPRPSFCAPPLPEESDEKDAASNFARSLCSEAFDLLLSETSSGGNSQSEDVSMTSSNDCLTLEPRDHSFSLSSGSQPMSLLHWSAHTSSGQHGVIGDRSASKEQTTSNLTLSSGADLKPSSTPTSPSGSAQTSLDWWLSGVRSHSMTDTDNESVCSSISDASVTTDASSSASPSRVDDLYEHSDSGDSTTASPALVSESSASESCTIAHLSFELAAADLRSAGETESSDGSGSECKTDVIGRLVSPGRKNRHKTSKKRRSFAMTSDDSESESGSDTEAAGSGGPRLKRQQSPRAKHRRSLSPPSVDEQVATRSLSPPCATAGATSPRNSRKRSLSPDAASTSSKRRPSSPDNVRCASCDVVQEHKAAQAQQESSEKNFSSGEKTPGDVDMADASQPSTEYEEKDAECTHAHQSRRTTRASSPSSASRAQRTRIQNEESEKRQNAAAASASSLESVTVTCIMTTKSSPRVVLTRAGATGASKDARTRIVHLTSSLNSKARPFVPQQQLPPAAGCGGASPSNSSPSSSLNVNARPFVPRSSNAVSNGCRSTVLPSGSRGGISLFSDSAATA